jgi:hypothetical protein
VHAQVQVAAVFSFVSELVLRPTHRDHELTCRGSMYLIKQKTWSGGSGGKGSFQDCG